MPDKPWYGEGNPLVENGMGIKLGNIRKLTGATPLMRSQPLPEAAAVSLLVRVQPGTVVPPYVGTHVPISQSLWSVQGHAGMLAKLDQEQGVIAIDMTPPYRED